MPCAFCFCSRCWDCGSMSGADEREREAETTGESLTAAARAREQLRREGRRSADCEREEESDDERQRGGGGGQQSRAAPLAPRSQCQSCISAVLHLCSALPLLRSALCCLLLSPPAPFYPLSSFSVLSLTLPDDSQRDSQAHPGSLLFPPAPAQAALPHQARPVHTEDQPMQISTSSCSSRDSAIYSVSSSLL